MVDASRVLDEFNRYMSNGEESWYRSSPDRALPGPIAYFCAEYGIHESMQIYSGGLGVLAGDHCKSASDAALPFIGLGLLYRRGYFRQQIDADGHQEHAQPDLDPGQLPLRRARGLDGAPLDVEVEVADRLVHAAVWVAQVGPRADPAARHRRPGQRQGRSTDHPHPLRPRTRDAAVPGARARHRRRPRPAGPRDRPGRLAPQRGPLRVPADRARPRAAGRRSEPRRSRGAPLGSVAMPSSRSIPPSLPGTRCSRATSSRPPCSRGSPPRAWSPTSCSSWAAAPPTSRTRRST